MKKGFQRIGVVVSVVWTVIIIGWTLVEFFSVVEPSRFVSEYRVYIPVESIEQGRLLSDEEFFGYTTKLKINAETLLLSIFIPILMLWIGGYASAYAAIWIYLGFKEENCIRDREEGRADARSSIEAGAYETSQGRRTANQDKWGQVALIYISIVVIWGIINPASKSFSLIAIGELLGAGLGFLAMGLFVSHVPAIIVRAVTGRWPSWQVWLSIPFVALFMFFAYHGTYEFSEDTQKQSEFKLGPIELFASNNELKSINVSAGADHGQASFTAARATQRNN